jgi:hypothetical protein
MARLIAAFLGLTFPICSVGCGNNTPAEEPAKIPAEALAALEQAEEFELLSLDPTPGADAPKNAFRGWGILGRVKITDDDTRKRLIEGLKKGVAENDGMVAACFNPRHGICVSKDGKQADFVICFECLQVEVHVNDHPYQLLTTHSPQPVFDEVLRQTGVPLAPKPEQ